jgi:Glyoxalase/Bleomycin resistance protein/Dioxygenase superfamily
MTEQCASFFQVAWIVNDLEASMRRWLTTARCGPFFVVPHSKVERVLYRGAPATLDFSTALAQAGPIQIELIEQHSDGPSAYRDVYAKGQEGFHHLCMMTHAFDADLERHRLEGSVVATQGAFGDMRFAYVDTRSRLGHMTEIIEDRASIRELFKMVADAAINWDGANPVRVL